MLILFNLFVPRVEARSTEVIPQLSIHIFLIDLYEESEEAK